MSTVITALEILVNTVKQEKETRGLTFKSNKVAMEGKDLNSTSDLQKLTEQREKTRQGWISP